MTENEYEYMNEVVEETMTLLSAVAEALITCKQLTDEQEEYLRLKLNEDLRYWK